MECVSKVAGDLRDLNCREFRCRVQVDTGRKQVGEQLPCTPFPVTTSAVGAFVQSNCMSLCGPTMSAIGPRRSSGLFASHIG